MRTITGIAVLILTGVCSAQGLSVPRPVPAARASMEGEPATTTNLLAGTRPLERRREVGPVTRSPGPGVSFLTVDSPPDADQPMDVAFLADGSAAVVVHRDTDNVTFFDVNTRAITHTVAVGDTPTDVAVSPDGRYVVVPCVFSNAVSVISVATHAVVATVPVTGQQPFLVECTADSRYAVVAVINDGTNSAFSIIDLDTLTEVRSIPTSGQGVIGFFFSPENAIAGELFSQFALSPDSRTIVLPNRATNIVNVYDLIAGTLLGPIDTGVAAPGFADISTDGTTAVVGHEGNSRRVTEIDLATRTVIGSFATPDIISDRVIRVTRDKAYAITSISNNVIFVDLATGAEAARINTGSVGDIRLSFDGRYAFVSNFNCSVIDIPTRTRVATLSFAPCVPAATSPVGYLAVAVDNRFRENIQLYNINGASSAFLGYAQTGVLPEGDAARDMGISGDGRTVVVADNISRNVQIMDLATGTIRSWIPTGDRPLAAAITPDNRYAVVCNTDEMLGGLRGTISIIDLSTDTVVRTLSCPDRPSQVRIAPDSQTAYVLTVAGTDQVYFIHLAGAGSSILGSTAAGQTGSWQGVTYSTISGVELTRDGSVFAVCDSFNNRLNLYSTSTRAQLASVPVGTFPITVGLNPAGTRAYVANAFSNDLTVVNVSGASSAPITTVPMGTSPFTVNVDATGAFVYVGNNTTNTAAINVLSAASNTVVGSVPVGPATPRTTYLSDTDSILYVGTSETTAGHVLRIHAAGAGSSLMDSTAVGGTGSSMVFSPALHKMVLAIPGHIPDGVQIVNFGQPCPVDVNGDGTVNVGDFLGYLQFYASGDTRADFTGDGQVNVSDFLAFLSAYAAGCP
jgi:YVTN family beta-propeller protein